MCYLQDFQIIQRCQSFWSNVIYLIVTSIPKIVEHIIQQPKLWQQKSIFSEHYCKSVNYFGNSVPSILTSSLPCERELDSRGKQQIVILQLYLLNG